MKRIAVLFFGQPRQLKKASEFTKPFFDLSEQGIETDYFFHSWSMLDPKSKNKCYHVGHEDQINLDDQKLLNDINEIYSPVHVEIEDAINSEQFTECAQNFVNLYDSFGELEAGPHNFWGNNDLVKYKIGQLYSSQKVVRNRIKYENDNSINYDIVFRIRTDMAFRPSNKNHNLQYLKNGLNYYNKKFKNDKIIFVNYLHMSYGMPLCGDQNIWGKAESIDNVFGDCVDVYFNFLKNWLLKYSDGHFEGFGDEISECFHIEVAIPHIASQKSCGIIPLHTIMGAGDFSLIRDTVEQDDDYSTIEDKSANFFK